MKPIVLIINDTDNGKITLTKEQLEKYISDAYEQGYVDGQKTSPVMYRDTPNTITNPNITWTSPTFRGPGYNPYEVTCDTAISNITAKN